VILASAQVYKRSSLQFIYFHSSFAPPSYVHCFVLFKQVLECLRRHNRGFPTTTINMAPMRQPTVSRSQKFSPYPKSASIAKVTCKPTTSKPAKPAKASKPEKAIFRGLSVSIAGNIINSKGESEPYENIIRWFRLHGGNYDQEVQSDTTHLICSIEEYKARGPQGRLTYNSSKRMISMKISKYQYSQEGLGSTDTKASSSHRRL